MRWLRRAFEIEEEDIPEVVHAKLGRAFRESDQSFSESFGRAVEAVLLLNASEEPGRSDIPATELSESEAQPALQGETLKRHLYDGVLKYVLASTHYGPLVLVFDDLHWSDPASVDLVAHLFQAVEQVPLLIVCAFRPYRQAPCWGLKQIAETQYPHRYTEIALQPLQAQDSDTLVTSLLSISELPGELRRLIQEKAEGNPLFVEEIIRSLIEDGVIERRPAVESGRAATWQAARRVTALDVPDNLQNLLLARIDRLEVETRRTLQLASVIGRTFYERLLEKISEVSDRLWRHLNDLQRVELIMESARLPELEYMFRHELMRDAAYYSILRRERRIFHRRVAEAIEQLYADRLEEEAHRLAYHYEQAGETARALKYYEMAGDTALHLYANAEAADHFAHAINLAQHASAADEQIVSLTMRHGRALELCGQFEQALHAYQTLEKAGEEHAKPAISLAAMLAQATILLTPTTVADYQKGRGLAEQALTLAKELADVEAEARAYWTLMLAENASSQMEAAVQAGEASIAIARQHDLRRELAFALNDIATSYFTVGRVEEAFAAHDEAQALWRELGNLPMLVDSLGVAAQGYYLLGEYDTALEHAEQGVRLARQISQAWGQAFCMMTTAAIQLRSRRRRRQPGNLDPGSGCR